MRQVLYLWRRWTLAQQFMLTSLVVLVTSMVAVGWWVSREIEAGVVQRTAATTSLYVESFVAPNLTDRVEVEGLPPDRIGALSRLLADTPLGREIVVFKLWAPNGRVLFSTETEMIGQVYPIKPELAAAAGGSVVSEISTLEDEENGLERDRFSSLLETYSPIRLVPDGEVVAVAELYETTEALERDLAAAQRHTWLAFALVTVTLYLTLAGLVKRGSDTIERQQRALLRTIDDLSAILAQNEQLHARVRRAATRVTTLSERSLRRISAELHDGPAQEISFALLRLGALEQTPVGVGRAEPTSGPPGGSTGDANGRATLDSIQASLTRALREIRHIASGLRLPELDALTLAQSIERVVHVHERRTSSKVICQLGTLPATATLPMKITVYRVVQEALANAFHHAHGLGQQVEVTSGPDGLVVRIADAGPGLQPADDGTEHLGLAVMRERVRSMGGRFSIESPPEGGTVVVMTLPCDAEKEVR